MGHEQSNDEVLLRFYESVRHQVEMDRAMGSRHRLVGEGVKRYAETLGQEMDRRRLRFDPIDWS